MSNQPEDDTEEALDEGSTRNLVVGLAIAVEGGMIGVAWLIGWLIDVPALEKLKWNWSGLGWGLLATIPMLAGFFVASRYPIGPLRSIKKFTDETILPMMASCSLIDLAGISVLAGLGEELLFRAVLQQAFAGWMPFWLALVCSAILFGILHAMTPSYAVLATGMGIYLGLVFYLTDNLLSVVIAHALYDFIALVWITHTPDGLPRPPDEPFNQSD